MGSQIGFEREVVVLACAVSAGIHGALVPDHFHEGAGPGLSFLVAAVLLGGLVVVLTRRPTLVATAAAGAVLAGLLAGYALATTTGIPLLHPELEPVDSLALATKAIEALGLVAALHLLGGGGQTAASGVIRTKGVRI